MTSYNEAGARVEVGGTKVTKRAMGAGQLPATGGDGRSGALLVLPVAIALGIWRKRTA